jgi:Family of unknown function (DUF6220)
MQVLRAMFAVISWVFLGMVVLQVFYAGVGLFGAGDMTAHVGFGYLVVLVPLLVLIAAALARAGGRLIGLAALLLFLTFLQPTLAYAREDAPYIAALHPVNALAIAGLGLVIALRATALARAPRAAGVSGRVESS